MIVIGWGNGFTLKEQRFRLDVGGNSLLSRCCVTGTGCPENCGGPVPGSAQVLDGGPEKPDLMGGHPAHDRGGWN